jgi:hypothetical protein
MNKGKKTLKKKRVFVKKDFKSGDGMLTSVWGPALWHFLHTMSFNYPIQPTLEDKQKYKNFVIQLQYILPCKYCRINLKNNFKVMPLKLEDMKNRETFSRYVYLLHEKVNTMLKKKSNLTYCDVRERYEHFRARCADKQPEILPIPVNPKPQSEKGCTEPLYGPKSKCVIKIIPQEQRCPTFQMDHKCLKKRLHSKTRKIVQHRLG